jgi:AI-2 transport protein TqsA
MIIGVEEGGAVCEQTIRTDAKSPRIIRDDGPPHPLLFPLMSETPPSGPIAEAPTLATASRWVVIVVGAFFLLRELGPILKPLFLAVLLGYVILPVHLQVKKWVPGRLSLAASAILSLILILLITVGIQASVRTLAAEMPRLTAKAEDLQKDFLDYTSEKFPGAPRVLNQMTFPDSDSPVREFTARLVAVAADTLTTAVVVGLYLLFLLLEAGRFPDRVHKTFSDRRAERILHTISGINTGIAHFLTAKVKASLLLAVPIFVVLIAFQTPFALIWAILVFFCNFVPYLGSVVGYSVPALFALVHFLFGWEFLTIAIAMLAIHLVMASVVEPAIIGKAVGLSPVIILFSLAFWGSIWGLTGMLLAVPLTVMLKIIGQHVDATRPLAMLVSDE